MTRRSEGNVGGRKPNRKRYGVPRPSTPATHKRMMAQKREGTGCERRLRAAVFSLGLRYRLHVRPEASLRRVADLVFRRARVAVFVDGCFWHGCPTHSKPTKAHSEWWATKIEHNKNRDRETSALLSAQGWLVARVWEHTDPRAAARQVATLVRSRYTNRRPLVGGVAVLGERRSSIRRPGGGGGACG